MATGEIRLSILWEWLHKHAAFSAGDESGVKAGDKLTPELFAKLLAEEYDKLLKAGNRDVHEVSKSTTLPIAREIVETYVTRDRKLPWYIDLLEREPQQRRSHGGETSHPAVHRGVRKEGRAADGESGFLMSKSELQTAGSEDPALQLQDPTIRTSVSIL